jgi:nucleotide-binding universal stress UspA family protein
MRRIAVGYDGSTQAADALALGRALAELLEIGVADVAVALVLPDGTIGASGQRTLDGTQRRLAGRVLDGARRAWPELTPGAFRVIQARTPAEGLHRLAFEHDVDALVVGSSHRGAPGRILPGSVTERALHLSPCAVLVAPAGYAADTDGGRRPLRRIGVAYDGSAEAIVALAEAERLATGRDGVHVRTIEAADPVHELLDACGELDLLLLGSRDQGPFERTLHGSVSTPVLRGAACPLLLFPRGSVVVRDRDRAHPRWRLEPRSIA